MDKLPRQQGEFEEYSEEAAPSHRSARLTWGLRAAGLIAAFLVWLALGGSEGLAPDARWVAAVGTHRSLLADEAYRSVVLRSEPAA